MAFRHRLQKNRFELKYLIDEATAKAIREFSLSYLEADEHNDPALRGYYIHSVYLDSPDLTLCRATMDGQKNRFKLRVRFYDNSPESPVFFEIKRRVNDAILKQRAAVRRDLAPRLVAGHMPSQTDLVNFDGGSWHALQEFCDLRRRINGQAQVIVSYIREAYVPADNDESRVTFDRHVRAGPYRGKFDLEGYEHWPRARIPGVILELKFTNRFPDWMHDMAQLFNLSRTSVPKYVECMAEMDGAPGRKLIFPL